MKITFLLALCLGMTGTNAFASPLEVDSDKVMVLRDNTGAGALMLPVNFLASESYMLVGRHGVQIVVPYPSAVECAHFANELGGCMYERGRSQETI